MYPTNFLNINSKEFLSEVLKTNLSDFEFELIQNLLININECTSKFSQQTIDLENENFLQQHPEAIKSGQIEVKRNTMLGTIKVKIPRYRNAEFRSTIITPKARMLVLMEIPAFANGNSPVIYL